MSVGLAFIAGMLVSDIVSMIAIAVMFAGEDE